MKTHRIAWLPGDGIGNDVMEATRLVLDNLGLKAEYVHGDIGWEFWKNEGDPLPARTIKLLKETDCCLFGAITSKPKEEAALELNPDLQNKGFEYFSPIVRLRQEFDLHTNIRPCKAYPGNPLNFKENIDLVVFRENSEGLYSGIEFHPLPNEVRKALTVNKKMNRFANVKAEDIAVSMRLMTRNGCERIVKGAFEYAKKYNRKSVTIVDKPNVLRETGGLMLRSARKVAADYPAIQMWDTNIDAQCMWLLKNPFDYDVLVAENMFGDILSDLAAQLVGGLGFAASGNIGDNYAVFEPTHGSAPKYAGKNIANPMAMFITARMMLEWLDEIELSDKLEKSITLVIREGKIRTRDMGGTSTTMEMAEEVAHWVKEF